MTERRGTVSIYNFLLTIFDLRFGPQITAFWGLRFASRGQALRQAQDRRDLCSAPVFYLLIGGVVKVFGG